jgi:hypothetical protein
VILANYNERPLVYQAAFVFRAVPVAPQLPAIVPAAAVIYTPTQQIALVRFWAWGSAADPLVAGGGATTVALLVGNLIAGNTSIMFSNSIANVNGTGMGGGFTPSGVASVKFDQPALAPHSAFNDSAANVARTLCASCDAGTVTGTLNVRLHYYFVNPASLASP